MHVRYKMRKIQKNLFGLPVFSPTLDAPYSPTSASSAPDKPPVHYTEPVTPEESKKDDEVKPLIAQFAKKLNILYNDPNADLNSSAVDESLERDLKMLRERKAREEEEKRALEEAIRREQKIKQDRIEQEKSVTD